MFTVLLWKEYREQRFVWAALAFLGAIILLQRSILSAAGLLTDYPEPREMVCVLAAMVVGVYALVCGGMMLAGERENGTMAYLDALPGLRRRVWQGKFLAAVLLVLAQIAFLMCLSAALSLFEHWWEAELTLLGMLATGLWGLAWGMLFSSFGRNVVNVVLQSLGGQLAWYICLFLLVGLVNGLSIVFFGGQRPIYLNVLAFGFVAFTPVAALVGSARVFTRLDRDRLRATSASSRGAVDERRSTWLVLFWLAWRQARGFTIGIAAFALFLGSIVLLNRVLLWPVTTLLVGVLCGATAFADEQQGPFRFLGDQRLPLARLWLVKVGLRFAIAVGAALLVLAPSFLVTLENLFNAPYGPNPPFSLCAHLFRSDLLINLVPPGLFLTMWLVYGFSTGCLFGLLFRHGLASGVFALFTSALAAALWIPSLLSGGLHAWQVFGPPLLILFSTPTLMRPWAAGRIASWTTARRLTPFVVLAVLWIAGGIWYRILEIPNVPMKVDLAAFRASLPTPEQDEGGQLFHAACLRFDAARIALHSEHSPAAAPQPPAPGKVAEQTPMEQAGAALEYGWPDDDDALAAWLDKLYAGEWPSMLKKAADLPTGPFDDVRDMTAFSRLPATQPAREVALILAVRGLQRQAAGDDAAYVENLRIGLSLSRSLRYETTAIDLLVGRAVQSVLLEGLDRWLEKLNGRPDLLRQALDLLSRHLEETADDAKDAQMIEELGVKNTAEDSIPLLQEYIANDMGQRAKADPNANEEAAWVAAAWLVPWEHARQDRILHISLNGDASQLRELFRNRENYGPLPLIIPSDRTIMLLAKPDRLCAARAMQLKLALRWYQADNGKSADNLDELVPKYLPSIPLDPYDGQPFHYRLSHGEEIAWPTDANAPNMRKIPSGQGVLWAVGQDGIDNGGHRQASLARGETGPGEDVIFLVPLPPQAK